MYDVTHELSFEKAQKWVEDLNQVETKDRANIIKHLVGNKCDLNSEKVVSTSTGNEYAKQIGAEFSEISAKEDIGVEELFLDIAKALYLKNSSKPSPKPDFPGGNSVLEKTTKPKPGCKC